MGGHIGPPLRWGPYMWQFTCNKKTRARKFLARASDWFEIPPCVGMTIKVLLYQYLFAVYNIDTAVGYLLNLAALEVVDAFDSLAVGNNVLNTC